MLSSFSKTVNIKFRTSKETVFATHNLKHYSSYIFNLSYFKVFGKNSFPLYKKNNFHNASKQSYPQILKTLLKKLYISIIAFKIFKLHLNLFYVREILSYNQSKVLLTVPYCLVVVGTMRHLKNVQVEKDQL